MKEKAVLNDEVLVNLAIEPQARKRYLEMLAKPKKRPKILNGLNHNPRLNPKRTKWYDSFSEAVDALSIKPTTQVYVISDASELDQQYMPYEQAIEDVPFHYWGAIILVSPELAIYHGETSRNAAIISISA